MPATPKYDGSDSGPIALPIARQWVKNFRDQMSSPDEIRAHYFGRDVIDKMLSQPGCTGIRVYYALNDKMQKEVLIVGVDDKGNNQLPANESLQGGDNIIADISFPCPSVCPGSGDL
jgi:hypothetical protein